mmetsp:Transcript_11459/g.36426  ORF Transcript_11459/g.36426 Transcript_11459/m.36426 type:complete len:233 (-) Transcript_11459:71-769(-)
MVPVGACRMVDRQRDGHVCRRALPNHLRVNDVVAHPFTRHLQPVRVQVGNVDVARLVRRGVVGRAARQLVHQRNVQPSAGRDQNGRTDRRIVVRPGSVLDSATSDRKPVQVDGQREARHSVGVGAHNRWQSQHWAIEDWPGRRRRRLGGRACGCGRRRRRSGRGGRWRANNLNAALLRLHDAVDTPRVDKVHVVVFQLLSKRDAARHGPRGTIRWVGVEDGRGIRRLRRGEG